MSKKNKLEMARGEFMKSLRGHQIKGMEGNKVNKAEFLKFMRGRTVPEGFQATDLLPEDTIYVDEKKYGGMSKIKKYNSGKMVTKDGYEQLLPPGEDPGEGYRGSPDMYPDYEEDRKEAEALKNKNRNRNSSGKTKSMAYGGSVMVKTKLGRNKPTKIC